MSKDATTTPPPVPPAGAGVRRAASGDHASAILQGLELRFDEHTTATKAYFDALIARIQSADNAAAERDGRFIAAIAACNESVKAVDTKVEANIVLSQRALALAELAAYSLSHLTREAAADDEHLATCEKRVELAIRAIAARRARPQEADGAYDVREARASLQSLSDALEEKESTAVRAIRERAAAEARAQVFSDELSRHRTGTTNVAVAVAVEKHSVPWKVLGGGVAAIVVAALGLGVWWVQTHAPAAPPPPALSAPSK